MPSARFRPAATSSFRSNADVEVPSLIARSEIRSALLLTASADEQAMLKAKLSDKPVLASCEANKKEFGLA